MKTVSLKDGMPTVPEALQRLRAALHRLQNEKFKLMKFVHGYGSKGLGGDIRLAVQGELVRMQSSGELRAVIFGEDWRISHEATWELLQRMPELKRDPDLGRENRGISIVAL